MTNAAGGIDARPNEKSKMIGGWRALDAGASPQRRQSFIAAGRRGVSAPGRRRTRVDADEGHATSANQSQSPQDRAVAMSLVLRGFQLMPCFRGVGG